MWGVAAVLPSNAEQPVKQAAPMAAATMIKADVTEIVFFIFMPFWIDLFVVYALIIALNGHANNH